MPKLMGNVPTETNKTLSNFSYTGTAVENLGASEYTIVTIVQDSSPSVAGFKKEMENCLKTIVEACKKSPRSENLLLRLAEFNNDLNEIHGFTELRNVDINSYTDCLTCKGLTALFDATLEGIEATESYAQKLFDMDYLCNAVIFVVTDGDDNNSKIAAGQPEKVAEALKRIRRKEILESVTVILVGVGGDSDPVVMQLLTKFKEKGELDQIIDMGDATPQKLAKLAQFVSQSISSTSQALGTGQASQPLTF